jgi:hypothetical protein
MILLLILVDIVLLLSSLCFLTLIGSAVLCRVDTFSCYAFDYGSLSYIAPAFLFFSTAADQILRHRKKVHCARLEDRSEVERLFLDPALRSDAPPPEREHLEKLGPEGWTEYQVLPLRQLIVQKTAPEALAPMAETILSVLKDYADDTSYQYDTDLYYEWKSKIDLAVANYERDPE